MRKRRSRRSFNVGRVLVNTAPPARNTSSPKDLSIRAVRNLERCTNRYGATARTMVGTSVTATPGGGFFTVAVIGRTVRRRRVPPSARARGCAAPLEAFESFTEGAELRACVNLMESPSIFGGH